MEKLNSLTDTFTLNNGVKIPCIGFGTWQSPDGDISYNAVKAALDAGYRHIDTATAYGNEESVGKAIRDFISERGIKRDEIFVTTKLHNNDHGYDNTKRAIDSSLSLLGLDYIDLYLIHWPNPIMYRDDWKNKDQESWKAMEEAYRDGKLRAIGLSNFFPRHIDAILEKAEILPAVNQIKFCPSINAEDAAAYSREKGMLLEAYSPMGTGAVLNNSEMIKIANKYNKTTAQVCIRYALQSGYLPLPKSVTPERIKSNTDVFSFELTDEDIERIANLKVEGVTPLRNPDETTF